MKSVRLGVLKMIETATFITQYSFFYIKAINNKMAKNADTYFHVVVCF